MINNFEKIFLPSVIAFVVGIILTPIIASWLYKNKMWKKKAGKIDAQGNATVIFNELHKDKEVGTPRMGGMIIWLSAAITVCGIWLLAKIFPSDLTHKIDFLSRNQTWIPLATLALGGIIGAVDDFFEIKGNGDHIAGGLSLKKRLIIVSIISFLVALWFYFKLEVTGIGLPFGGSIPLGLFFIPFFVVVTIALYSGGVIDGVDGLAGGIFATIFAAYGGIAFFQQQINLSALCFAIVGSILAFLWFNIPPARFYMSETGTMALTITLAVVAFMTDSLGNGYGIIILPIVALPLVVTVLSNIIQVISKKYRGGKKVFKVAPLHHHFEAIGWPAYKVTMRYWVVGIIFGILGMVLAIIG